MAAPQAPPGAADAASSSVTASPPRFPRRRRHASLPERHLAAIATAATGTGHATTPGTSASLDAVRSLREMHRKASSSDDSTVSVALSDIRALLGAVETMAASIAEPAAAAAAFRLQIASVMEPALASHFADQFAGHSAAGTAAVGPAAPKSSLAQLPAELLATVPTRLPQAPASPAESAKAEHLQRQSRGGAREAAAAATGGDLDSATGVVSPTTRPQDAAAQSVTASRANEAATASTDATTSAAARLAGAREVLHAVPAAQTVLSAAAAARTIVAEADAAQAIALGARAHALPPAAPAPSSPASAHAIGALLAELTSWQFDIFALAALRPHTVIETVAMACLWRHDLVKSLKLSETALRTWLRAVEGGYTDPPYHNRVHGADVCQTTFWFTWSGKPVALAPDDAAGIDTAVAGGGASKAASAPAASARQDQVTAAMSGGGMAAWLTPEECLSLVLGAASHDTGHFGRNNPFLVATRHPLALRYNDRSPLESMHAARSFEIMRDDPAADWLAALPPASRASVRSDMLSAILATDNAEHFPQLHRLQAAMQAARAARTMQPAEEPAASSSSSASASASDQGTSRVMALEEDRALRSLVKGLALHAADVSNPAKSFPFAAVWADRVRREFYEQGDEERERGLPIAMGFDRHAEIPMPKFQLGFIRAIVQPLYASLQALNCDDLEPDATPWFTLQHPLDQLDTNVATWEARLAQQASQPAAKSVAPPKPPPKAQ